MKIKKYFKSTIVMFGAILSLPLLITSCGTQQNNTNNNQNETSVFLKNKSNYYESTFRIDEMGIFGNVSGYIFESAGLPKGYENKTLQEIKNSFGVDPNSSVDVDKPQLIKNFSNYSFFETWIRSTEKLTNTLFKENASPDDTTAPPPKDVNYDDFDFSYLKNFDGTVLYLSDNTQNSNNRLSVTIYLVKQTGPANYEGYFFNW